MLLTSIKKQRLSCSWIISMSSAVRFVKLYWIRTARKDFKSKEERGSQLSWEKNINFDDI